MSDRESESESERVSESERRSRSSLEHEEEQWCTMEAQNDTGMDMGDVAKQSKKDCRVYVGNLSYDVRSEDLTNFMSGGAWCESTYNFAPACSFLLVSNSRSSRTC